MNALDAPLATGAQCRAHGVEEPQHMAYDVQQASDMDAAHDTEPLTDENTALDTNHEMKLDENSFPDAAESALESTTDDPSATESSVKRASVQRRRRSARPSQPMLAAGPPIRKAAAAAAAAAANAPSTTATTPAQPVQRAPVHETLRLETPHTDAAEAAHDLKQIGLSAGEDDEELASYNNDVCETCGGPGHFLCCDGCPRSFHFACMNPPLDTDEMPFPNGTLLRNPPTADPRLSGRATANDSWFCRVCFAAQQQPRQPPGAGPFAPLLAKIECENPSLFSLPADIRNYFKGVSTAPDGAYVDSTMLRPLRLNRQGFVEQRDPHALKDKHGNAVLCYKCGGSALPESGTQWRAIIGCDFCRLHWHLDCVDPPMSSMPSMTRRWRCPAHTDSLEPKKRIPRGTQYSTIDVPVPEPGTSLQKRKPAPVDVVLDPNDDHFNPDGSGKSTAPPWKDVTMTSNTGAQVRYRIPEKTIQLEFWNKAMLEKPRPLVQQQQAPRIPAPAPHASELDKLVAVALRNTQPQENVGPTLRDPQLLAENAQAAAHSLSADSNIFTGALRSSYLPDEAEPLVPGAAPDNPAYERRNPPHPPITYLYPGEIAELRAVKRLMAAKGADRLREWLHSGS